MANINIDNKTNDIDKAYNSLDSALTDLFGKDIKVVHSDRIAGGDINEAYALTLTDGSRIFMKSNTKENSAFFSAEAAGLTAIANTKAIRTPKIFCTGVDDSGKGFSFLLLEFISGKGRIKNYWEVFAQELAKMHMADTTDFVNKGNFGFLTDNFIGERRQKNKAYDSFIEFFRDCRLKPQFNKAEHYFDKSIIRKINKLMDNIDKILVEPEYPSLLHGDLWSGNVITGNDNKAWLIDPAVYVGHAEADIAMTELFGGFPKTFYDAYRENGNLADDYSYRRDLYNLYQLLNHLNMFGISYLSSVIRIINEYT